jgi:hypothetical protein
MEGFVFEHTSNAKGSSFENWSDVFSPSTLFTVTISAGMSTHIFIVNMVNKQ